MPLKILILSLLILIAAALLNGCGNSAQPSTQPPATQPAYLTVQDKPGAQLWSENCSRCHNMRPPESFSDAQWETIVRHMRFRANLTGVEARKITEFLKASH